MKIKFKRNQHLNNTFVQTYISTDKVPMKRRKKEEKKGKMESKTKIYIVFPIH